MTLTATPIDPNDYRDGYQSPPVNWGLNTERKQGFFDLVGRASGAVQGG